MATEKRLIYLDDAKEALTGWDTDPTDEEIEYTLDCLPKVDAVEVVHGRWIVKGQEVFCSHCDKESGYNHWGASAFSDYCPNCGAKMLPEPPKGE